MNIQNNTTQSDSKRILAEFKLRVKEAWVVMSLLPDKDARFRAGLRGAWTLPVVYDAAEALREGGLAATVNYNPPWLKQVPSPAEITQAEIIMGWMIWLRQTEGELSLRRIIGWSMGAPWCNLGAREKCSDRTVKNRIDRSLALVLDEFLDTPIEVEVIDEPELSNRRPRWFAADREVGENAGEIMPGKIFVAGVGMMQYGKPCKTNENMIDRAEARWRRRG